jgi:hypothetical protein
MGINKLKNSPDNIALQVREGIKSIYGRYKKPRKSFFVTFHHFMSTLEKVLHNFVLATQKPGY